MHSADTSEVLDAWGQALGPQRLVGGSVDEPPEPITLEMGYLLAEKGRAVLGTPAGWKIGATSERAMAFLAVREPIIGRVYAERLWRDGDRADLSGDRVAEAEPEIAFRLERPLASGAPVLGAIGEVRAAAEIVRPSHANAFALGAGFIVADNAAGVGALIGPSLPIELLQTPETLCVSLKNERGDTCEGSADEVLGNPLEALAWLAQHLGEIPAGSWVLSGAMARAIPLSAQPGMGQLVLDAGEFGTARLGY
ncbi:MAG: hypothetical protein V2I27_14010 [Erythrobacter sp.]|jgi:2-keto-4-pentenoate hydratase|nr:hypothetical protein [Erythrobacter sp.]